MSIRAIVLAAMVLSSSMTAFAGPPVPAFLDTEPGLFLPFVGDLNDPDTWNYEAIEWGGSRHISPPNTVWQMVDSPFSDAGAACRGNMPHPDPNQAMLPCPNLTRRYHPTFKNPVDSKDRVPMDPSKDWVFTASFVIENTDTFGVDRLIELAVPGGDMIKVYGAK